VLIQAVATLNRIIRARYDIATIVRFTTDEEQLRPQF
jgi:hypothetical protein